jgi:hypothetical protein
MLHSTQTKKSYINYSESVPNNSYALCNLCQELWYKWAIIKVAKNPQLHVTCNKIPFHKVPSTNPVTFNMFESPQTQKLERCALQSLSAPATKITSVTHINLPTLHSYLMLPEDLNIKKWLKSKIWLNFTNRFLIISTLVINQSMLHVQKYILYCLKTRLIYTAACNQFHDFTTEIQLIICLFHNTTWRFNTSNTK